MNGKKHCVFKRNFQLNLYSIVVQHGSDMQKNTRMGDVHTFCYKNNIDIFRLVILNIFGNFSFELFLVDSYSYIIYNTLNITLYTPFTQFPSPQFHILAHYKQNKV